MNRDPLTNIKVQVAALATMHVIDSIQHMSQAEQVAGLTAAFKLVTERLDISPSDAFTVAHNFMHDASGKRTEFEAVAMYLKHEFKN